MSVPSIKKFLNADATEGDINLSDRRAIWQEANLGPQTQELLERDAAVFLHQSLSTPCLNALAGAEGSWLIDVEGRRYLDFHGNSAHQVGYGHPQVVQALKDQLDTLPFSPRRYTNEPAVRLAEKLSEIGPIQNGKILLAPGGAEVIGIAMKLARLVTGRFKTVSMWDSFHGASLDAISIGGETHFRKGIGPLLPGSEHVPPPDPVRCPLGCGGICSMACASYLEYVLEKEGDVGAVIAEPVRCTTAIKPPTEYWQRVRAACDKHGALLIFDEIPVGLGRTGVMFATELTSIVPDMVVLGKGLGGGLLPLAALIANPKLDIGQETSLGHYTHEKSPLAAAAALATLQVIEEEGLVKRSHDLGAYLVNGLQKLAETNERMVEVRGLGLLIAVEMRSKEEAERILYECLSLGLSFKVSSGTVLTLTPPLTLSDDEADQALAILAKTL